MRYLFDHGEAKTTTRGVCDDEKKAGTWRGCTHVIVILVIHRGKRWGQPGVQAQALVRFKLLWGP
jgi:hypothetical protein